MHKSENIFNFGCKVYFFDSKLAKTRVYRCECKSKCISINQLYIKLGRRSLSQHHYRDGGKARVKWFGTNMYSPHEGEIISEV